MQISILVCAWCAVLHLVAGCNADGGNADLKPCPAGGIGASAATQEYELKNYKQYACTQAQICPDEGSPWAPSFVIDPKAPAASINLGLTNCSTGQQRLAISKIVIAGDTRCFFSEATLESPTVDPGRTVVIKVDYKPTAKGEDHAQFQIHSNAANFPLLKVPFCSSALDRAPTPSGDAGAADGGTRMRCNEVTTVNGTCHKS